VAFQSTVSTSEYGPVQEAHAIVRPTPLSSRPIYILCSSLKGRVHNLSTSLKSLFSILLHPQSKFLHTWLVHNTTTDTPTQSHLPRCPNNLARRRQCTSTLSLLPRQPTIVSLAAQLTQRTQCQHHTRPLLSIQRSLASRLRCTRLPHRPRLQLQAAAQISPTRHPLAMLQHPQARLWASA